MAGCGGKKKMAPGGLAKAAKGAGRKLKDTSEMLGKKLNRKPPVGGMLGGARPMAPGKMLPPRRKREAASAMEEAHRQSQKPARRKAGGILKAGKALYNAGKKKLQSITKGSKKTTPKKSTVKPATIDFKKAKRTLAGTAGVGAGVGYMAGRSGNKKVETKKPAPKKTETKKEQTYYKSNPNKSNAPRPDYTSKKTETKKDRSEMGKSLQKKAQASMGFKKGGMVKRDGCAVRGKTRGKLI